MEWMHTLLKILEVHPLSTTTLTSNPSSFSWLCISGSNPCCSSSSTAFENLLRLRLFLRKYMYSYRTVLYSVYPGGNVLKSVISSRMSTASLNRILPNVYKRLTSTTPEAIVFMDSLLRLTSLSRISCSFIIFKPVGCPFPLD